MKKLSNKHVFHLWTSEVLSEKQSMCDTSQSNANLFSDKSQYCAYKSNFSATKNSEENNLNKE